MTEEDELVEQVETGIVDHFNTNNDFYSDNRSLSYRITQGQSPVRLQFNPPGYSPQDTEAVLTGGIQAAGHKVNEVVEDNREEYEELIESYATDHLTPSVNVGQVLGRPYMRMAAVELHFEDGYSDEEMEGMAETLNDLLTEIHTRIYDDLKQRAGELRAEAEEFDGAADEMFM